MAWVPAAITGGSSILGGLIGNKGAKQNANDAANAQMQLANQMFDKQTAYDQQQQQQQRSAIAGLLGSGNPFMEVAGQLKPRYEAPGQNIATFGSTNAPGTFSGSPVFGGNFNPFAGLGGQPQPGGTPVGMQPGQRRPEPAGGATGATGALPGIANGLAGLFGPGSGSMPTPPAMMPGPAASGGMARFNGIHPIMGPGLGQLLGVAGGAQSNNSNPFAGMTA